ncbi:hypothetical protein [Streptomyces massasporeus]|uniref:hypothetical protein n=1 Tax=Streptomyces massasporeus TaxID=67324 RepID=UPI00380511B7
MRPRPSPFCGRVVGDLAALHAAHDGTGSHLQDMAAGSVPDSGQLGPELTHGIRGLQAWLPLHLHGVDAFRAALDEKLDLAEDIHDTLSGLEHLEVSQRPDLSTVIFRIRPTDTGPAAAGRADEARRRLLERINHHRRIVLSSTVVDDRYTLRVCVVSHRTHHDRIAEALRIITAESRNMPVTYLATAPGPGGVHSRDASGASRTRGAPRDRPSPIPPARGTAIVTGASSGIGAAYARGPLRKGTPWC